MKIKKKEKLKNEMHLLLTDTNLKELEALKKAYGVKNNSEMIRLIISACYDELENDIIK